MTDSFYSVDVADAARFNCPNETWELPLKIVVGTFKVDAFEKCGLRQLNR